MVIKGAWHLSDYVTKLMKRLSDQKVDPKVVLELGLSQSYQEYYDKGPTDHTTVAHRLQSTSVPHIKPNQVIQKLRSDQRNC